MPYVYKVPARPEDSVGFPEAGVIGGNRANHLTGAETKAGVLGK